MKLPLLDELVGRIDRLTRRDRMVLLAGVLALAVAAELQIVLPMQERRLAFLAQPDAPAPDPALAEATARQQARLAEIEAELAQRRTALARQGLDLPPQAVFGSLREALAQTEVQLLGLQTLAGRGEAAAPAGPTTEAASPAALLLRHRTELRVTGELSEVLRLVQRFEQEGQPLRLARVRFGADPASAEPDHVQAVLELLTLTREDAWLAL